MPHMHKAEEPSGLFPMAAIFHSDHNNFFSPQFQAGTLLEQQRISEEYQMFEAGWIRYDLTKTLTLPLFLKRFGNNDKIMI